jgi:hypothetical protein
MAWYDDLNTFLTPSTETMQSIGKVAPLMQIAGMATSAIGSYYGAKIQQEQLKSQASNLRYQSQSQAMTLQFQKDMATLNAGLAENDAQQILLAGEREAGQISRRYGRAKSGNRASMAARGVQLGEGSTAEVEASIELAKQQDMLTINANRVRAAESARMQRTNYQTQASMLGVSASNVAGMGELSASNLMRSADTINPYGNMFSSLLGSAGTVASTWYRDNELAALRAAIQGKK